MIKNFFHDLGDFGLSTAWYNLRFLIAFWLVGADSMKVKRKK